MDGIEKQFAARSGEEQLRAMVAEKFSEIWPISVVLIVRTHKLMQHLATHLMQ